jgi:alanine racemase
MTNSTRPTRVEISLSNLSNNLNIVKKIVGNTKVMGVVKANAYGHDLINISKHLEKENIDYLAVAFVEEGIELRNAGVNTPILVLGAINNDQIPLFLKNSIDLTGSSIEKLQAISKCAKDLDLIANVHLKIDTGMNRIGVQWDRVDKFLNIAFTLPNIKIVGIFSHFANSTSDLDFTNLQLKRFKSVLDIIFNRNKYCKRDDIIIHLSNSGAIANNLKDCFFDMVRPGLMLYGYSPIPSIQSQLKPVMSFKTKVGYFKVIDGGVTVGYDRTYVTKEQTRIVTLPVGYADGYPRSLSNIGKVLIGGKEYTISGRVCMDQCMVDIGMDGEAYNGDDVILFNDMWEVSRLADRSIYEILCSISQRVPRVLV